MEFSEGMPYLKITETKQHTLDKLKRIIHRCRPDVLVLESEGPGVNNLVLRHARYLSRNGWNREDIDIVTKYRQNNELNMISITLKNENNRG